MLIIDGHEDIAYNALEWKRDIRLSVHEVRKREGHTSSGEGAGGIAMSGLPELRRGGFGVVFGTIFVEPAFIFPDGVPAGLTQVYTTPEEAYRIGQQQLTYYHELAKEPGISLILTQEQFQSFLTSWEASSADDPQRPFGIIPLMEGADPIRTPDEVEEWFQRGVRILGLAWRGTRYSGGTGMPGPLTDAGKALLKEMQRVGMILDISHLAEESFWQALDLFSGPILASHSNCRVFTPTDRQISDEMIRALIERDAVIGILPGNMFLRGGWSRANRFPIHLDEVVRHIDHVCQLAGDTRHVAIGTDIDGGFGRDETPEELDTVADIIKIADALRAAGYKEEDIANVMHGNWQRLLTRSLPVA